MSTDLVSSRAAASAAAPGSWRRRLIETVKLWHQRSRSRHELAMLSELDMRDIGYPADIEAERHKPFWRP